MDLSTRIRANQFDYWVGIRQTQKSIELGVGESLLDIGCGDGSFTQMFLKKFKRVIGIDPDETLIKLARKNYGDTYFVSYGEKYEAPKKFDTINMTNLLEHTEDPVILLKKCKEMLNEGGRIIAQVPNSNSITRGLGVIMGVIPDIRNMTDKEKAFFGHQRTYILSELIEDVKEAGFGVIETGGVLYKPLPNALLEVLCNLSGEVWKDKFIDALVEFGKDRPEECAQIYICAG